MNRARFMKRLISWALMALMLVFSPALHAQIGNRYDTNLDRLAAAVNAINQGELTQADALLNSVLKAWPNGTDALNLLGVVRAKRIVRLKRNDYSVVRLPAPSHLGAHINLGETLIDNESGGAGARVLLRAHKLGLVRPEINLNLATLYADKEITDRRMNICV